MKTILSALLVALTVCAAVSASEDVVVLTGEGPVRGVGAEGLEVIAMSSEGVVAYAADEISVSTNTMSVEPELDVGKSEEEPVSLESVVGALFEQEN